VADLHEVALLSQLLDRITAIKQLADVAIDVGDLRFTAAGRGEARIEGEVSEIVVELADIDDLRADRPVEQWHIGRLAGDVIGDGEGLAVGFFLTNPPAS